MSIAAYISGGIGPGASIPLYITRGLKAAASCALTTTITDEASVVAGGETVVLELTNDTWAAPGTGPIGSTAVSQAIIDGISAPTSPAGGWNLEVRDKELVASLARTSATVATITWTAAPAYDISADETGIEATIPAAALVTSAIDVVATPTFTVTFVEEVAAPEVGGGGSAEPKKLPPFTGQGFFDEFEPFVEPEPEAPPQAADEAQGADTAETGESAQISSTRLRGIAQDRVADLAVERERRRRAQAEAEADRIAREAAELARQDSLRLMAFLEAEAAKLAAILVDDEAVLDAYLALEAAMRNAVLEHLVARQSKTAARSLEATLRRVVVDAIDRAATG